MEYEATVVLEKGYLDKSRISSEDDADAFTRAPGENGPEHRQEDRERVRREAGSATGSGQRESPLAKAGWFNKR